jgi:FAD:protein FMN transferase
LLPRVVRRALDVAAATDGVFDPTLGAEIATLGYDVTFDRIDHAGSRNGTRVVGGAWRQVEVDDAARTITLPAGARFDLGGIAKGMAVDASLSPLVGVGAETALVNAGGDMAVSGPLDQAEGWPFAPYPLYLILLRRGASFALG